MTTRDEFLSVGEVAASLGISAVTIRRWIDKGELAAFKLGDAPTSRIRIRRSEIDRYLIEHEVTAA